MEYMAIEPMMNVEQRHRYRKMFKQLVMNAFTMKGCLNEMRLGPQMIITEKYIFVPMTPWQQEVYEYVRKMRLERFAGINDRAGLPNKIRMLLSCDEFLFDSQNVELTN